MEDESEEKTPESFTMKCKNLKRILVLGIIWSFLFYGFAKLNLLIHGIKMTKVNLTYMNGLSKKTAVNYDFLATDNELSSDEIGSKFMKKLEKRMTERRNLLKEICKNQSLVNQGSLKVKYAVLNSRNLTYCFIPKAGCTNWKKIFMVLNGDTPDINEIEHNVHAFVSSHYRVDTVGIPKNTERFLKFLVVRNPLDRLYSSYKDKFAWQPGSVLPQFSKTSFFIHQQEADSKHDERKLATFEEFINFVSSDDHSTLYGLVANHWSSYQRICQPCTVKYDVIMHLETIEEDSRYLLNLINAPKNLKFPAGYGGSGSSSSKHDIVLQAFRKMKAGTLKKLRNAFKLDFDMFGYRFLE